MHYTYQPADGDLQQGDLIAINEPIKSLLIDVHPHYSNHKDYKFFMVLTQSCDLVRRQNGNCKSRYISLAAVRPLTTVLRREISKFQFSEVEKKFDICKSKFIDKMTDFLIKLTNNNIPGYFFIAEDTDCDIHDNYVAFLSLSIAIKTRLHYDKCVEARVAQLIEIFQAKLGWLVGNVYSRVGTPDWVPSQSTEDEYMEYIGEIINGTSTAWCSEKALKYIRSHYKRLGDSLTKDKVYELLDEYAEESSKKSVRIAKQVCELVQNYVEVDEKTLSKFEKRIINDDKIRALL